MIWRVLVAAVVTAAGLVASPVARPVARLAPALVAAGVCAVAGSWGGAAIATVLLLATMFAVARPPWVPTVAAALVGAGVQILFRLPNLLRDGVTAVLAITAGSLVVASAWRALGTQGHRVGRRAAWVGGALLAPMAIPVLVGGVLAWREIGVGSGEANAWRVATAKGDTDAAADHLDAASGAFEQAADRLSGWWMSPAKAVPYLSQHVEAADVGVRAARRSARSGGRRRWSSAGGAGWPRESDLVRAGRR